MAERFQKIPGTQKISESYGVIDQNFEQLDNELSAIEQRIESLDTLSPADRAKLDGIEEGAQVNQNAFAKVNDLEASNPSDAFTITGGTGITVTTNPNTKEVNVTATGEATPGPHGSAHLEFGSDPIPYATETTGGLMSAEDKQSLVELEGLPAALAAHMAETVTSVNAVAGYGADSTGATDTIAELTAAATAAAGKTLFLPPGNYQIGSTLTIPDNTTVFAYGARIFNTSSHLTLLKLSSGCKVYGLELEGAGNAATVLTGIAINLSGVDATNPVDTVLIQDCNIHDFGGYGIEGTWVKNVQIVNNVIRNIGYAGIGLSSAINCHATRNQIKGVSPGSGGNAYGIYYSRKTNSSDMTAYPRSKDCSATHNTIEDVTIWEALDTHAGENIDFSHNIIRNCAVGIAFVGATGDSGSKDYGCHECRAIGNSIYGIGGGYGIILDGAPADYNVGGVVQGNFLYQCGGQGNNLGGAIYMQYTKNAIVQGNTLKECYSNGIHAYIHNYNFSILGNTIIDQQDSTWVNCSGIAFRSRPNVGSVVGNVLLRENAALNTYVMEYGIAFSTTTDIDVLLGMNKIKAGTASYLAGRGSHVNYSGDMGLDGVRIYVNNGSPEGVITAAVGSLCINTAGGASTTLYVKTSGAGNTGWTAK